MNRRQLNRILGYALAAPFAAPAFANALGASPTFTKKSFLVQKSTWTDKQVQQAFRAFTMTNLYNTGIPENQIDIHFPANLPPTIKNPFIFDIEEIGLGSEFANDLLSGFNVKDMIDDVLEAEPSLAELFGDPEMAEQMLANTKALQDRWESMTSTNMVDPATAAFAGGVVLGVLLTITAAGVAVDAAYTVWDHMDFDDDGVLNENDAFPYDPKKYKFMLPDLDGNGIPDDIELIPGGVYFRNNFLAAGFSLEDFASVSADISVMADGNALIMNCALSYNGKSDVQQVILKA